MQILSNAIQIAQGLLSTILPKAKVIVDATTGNGNDTLFLVKNSSKDSHIYAFDIQQNAINNAKHRIDTTCNQEEAQRVSFIVDSHDKVANYVKENIDVAIFNLGYLPGGDHNITTNCDTTILAIEVILQKLNLNGYLAVVLYPGHDEGQREYQLIHNLVKSLPKKYYTVGWYRMINHNLNSPALCWIEKVGA